MRPLLKNPASWYVVALAVAWMVEALLPPDRLNQLMAWSSTNLANLHLWPAGHPVEALVVSAFVPQASPWLWPLFALSTYTAVSALGTRRALLTLAGTHIGASVVAQALVWWRIHHGELPGSESHGLDTGPSYVVVAAMTIAIVLARPVWLRAVWVVLLAVVTPALLEGIGDAEPAPIGHLLSCATGLTAALWAHLGSRPLGDQEVGSDQEVCPVEQGS
ncbi:rhomboid-like protein [Streptomyces sp. CT34]|uniref:rhomboid-like protein n=1 Tax=Streptomyces sp. CT34 TaxID=1553907 RepID=UPI000690552D|nr:rhomboid-like protein [Streptomyces sp. CT34]